MRQRLNQILYFFALFSLVILFFLEILLDYDTTTRQIVLSITDVVILSALLILYWVFKKRYNIFIPFYVAWLAALGVWFDAAGNFANLYHNILWWDKLAHVVGAAALAMALFVIIYEFNWQGRIKLGRFNLSLYVLSLSSFASAMYEVSEYLGDLISESKRVTDLFDTADDMMWNVLAAVLVVVMANLFIKKKKPT